MRAFPARPLEITQAGTRFIPCIGNPAAIVAFAVGVLPALAEIGRVGLGENEASGLFAERINRCDPLILADLMSVNMMHRLGIPTL